MVVGWAALDPYRGGVFHHDNRTLLALMLVGRLWMTRARVLLFQKVRIRATADEVVYRSAFAAFVREVHQLRRARSRLPSEVRALSIGCQSAYYGTTVDLAAIPALLQLLPNVRALHVTLLCAHLEIPDTFAFDKAQLAVLRAAPAARRITHLSMRSHISDPNVLHQFLGVFPAAHTLAIEAPRHTTVYDPPPVLPALRRLFIDASVSRKCLAYLYQCSISLRALVLATLNDFQRCALHFSGPPHRVRELVVLDSGFDADPTQLCTLANGFPHLTRLVVGFAIPRPILDSLPASLVHFGFDPHMSDTVAADVLAWLDGRVWVRSISTMYHPGRDDDRESEVLSRIRAYCRKTNRAWSEIYRMFLDDLVDSDADNGNDDNDDDDRTPRASIMALPG
ncbi:hypothetical protein BKA62DRAFT_743348 [Auriculariales sp. MPI-PUGE-AT-0066]|nr:hypothetical protein BKA62DRAFT_743348 [Auriculariales sp. MPI-PUGE-AT-0066]